MYDSVNENDPFVWVWLGHLQVNKSSFIWGDLTGGMYNKKSAV